MKLAFSREAAHQGLHYYHGRCRLGGYGRRQAGWNAGLHGWQAEDQGQHDAGAEAAVHLGGCQVSLGPCEAS